MAEIKLNIPTYGGSGRGYKSGVGSKSKKKPNEWTGYVKGELEGLAGISGAKILAKKAEEDATERTKMKGQIAVGTWGAITKGAVTRGANIAADLDAKRVFQKQIDETNIYRRQTPKHKFLSGYRSKDKFAEYDPAFLKRLETEPEFANCIDNMCVLVCGKPVSPLLLSENAKPPSSPPPSKSNCHLATKSPTIASCPLSVTVIVVDPLVAAKVAALVVVLRIGVTSLKEPPSSL